jgi:hypothetical protein
VLDDHGSPLTATANFTLVAVENSAPVIKVASVSAKQVPGVNGVNNDAVSFFALASDDFTALDSLTYTWTLVDSGDTDISDLLSDANAQGPTISAGDLDIDSYVATLSVSDGILSTEQDVTFDVVDNLAPTVVVTSDYLVTVAVVEEATYATAISFDTEISDESDFEDLTIVWSMTKNGESDDSSLTLATDRQTASIAANTLTAGDYVISVSVTDEYGLETTAMTSVSILADNSPTITSFTASPSSQGSTDAGVNESAITFSVSATDDWDENNLTYSWSFSDSISATIDGASAVIAAESIAIGEYSAEVSVEDSMQQIDTMSVTFSVSETSGNTEIIID